MTKIRITVNDREFIFESDSFSVSELLSRLNIPEEGIAVCVNGDIVRKRNFSDFVIKEGDKVDIITMVGGG